MDNLSTIVAVGNGYWGKGETLTEALNNCTGSMTLYQRDLRRATKVVIYAVGCAASDVAVDQYGGISYPHDTPCMKMVLQAAAVVSDKDILDAAVSILRAAKADKRAERIADGLDEIILRAEEAEAEAHRLADAALG